MRNLWLRSCLRIPVAAFVFLAATSTLPGLAEAQPSGCAAGARPDPPACPAGHAIAGSASPMGFEQWCERRDADGSVVEHGRYLAWNSSGWLREEGEYRAGRRHGRWTAWSVNRKSDEREYLDGELHGRVLRWAAYDDR